MVVSSNDPNTPPSSTKMPVTAATPGSRNAVPPDFDAGLPLGSGWVLRCSTSTVQPTVSTAVANSSAALGKTCSASTVANVGPAMKTTSSTSDSIANAVRNWGVPV